MTPLSDKSIWTPMAVASADQRNDEVSLESIWRMVVRRRRLVLGIGLATAVLVAAVTLWRPRVYTSSTSFTPQKSNNSMSRLSGFAAQFGFTMPIDDPGASPAFYASLLKSDELLRQVVVASYATTTDPTARANMTLVDVFDADGKTPEQRRDDAVKTLLANMTVTTGRETGIVGLEITTPYPELSQSVARRLIELVSEFNLQRRQTTAGTERRFVEGRLRETRDSLQRAQARLQAFLQRNRDFRNAPALTFEYDRLNREVQLRQEVYSTLTQSYEQARIDEVRNTPVITVIEPPSLPSRPDSRWLLVKVALGLIVGSLLGAFIAALREAAAPMFRAAPPVEERSATRHSGSSTATT